MEGVIAYVTVFAGNFAPRGWALCQGQILAISSNTALFSLLGTTYGGDGKVTFALPDLRGRAVIGAGQSPGLSDYELGQAGGNESTTMLQTNLPIHTHTANVGISGGCSSSFGNTNDPDNAVYAPLSTGSLAYGGNATGKMKSFNLTLNTNLTGSSLPFGIRNPYLSLTYVICISGIFPARP